MSNNRQPRLGVVIPALNEQATIGDVIAKVEAIGATVVVVDDGSTDRTAEIAEAVGAHVIRHENNKGYEPALATGVHAITEWGYELAATFDADDQLDVHDLNRFINQIDKDKSDIVIGVRDYRNRYSEYLLALYGNIRFGIRDPLCGLKLYRLEAAKLFFPFDTQRLVGMELAFRMKNAGLKSSQLNIHVEQREGASRYGSSLRGEMNILKSLFRVVSEFGFFR